MRLLVGALCILSLIMVGCGTNSSSSEENWINEINEQLEAFKSKGGTAAQEEIASATRPKQIEGAYLAYATILRGLKVNLEALDAPKACENFQNEMTRFIGELVTASEKLGNQSALTEADFVRIARKQNEASKHFEAELLKVSKTEKCPG